MNKYLPRLLEGKLRDYFQNFSCVLLSGARQVGKTTLLQHLFGQELKCFTFDPVQDLFGERRDPDLFLRNNPPPLILDEIQYVPNLVPSLKRYIDLQRRPGMFLITGSQQWQVMRHLAESLAGRLVILELPTFSLSEQFERPELNWFVSWLGADGQNLANYVSAGYSPAQILWRGSFPEVQFIPPTTISGWMQGYLNTYLQRDVRLLLDVRNETQFASFLALCAALTAQECNFRHMGRELDLSGPCAQSWLNVLRGSFQWLEIPAFSKNQTKKISQKPKGYITDTGLACYLLRISSPEALQGHPLLGALFETFVVNELHKQVQALGLPPAFYHYRLHSGAEIDLILELDGRLYPIEIKAAANVKPSDAANIYGFQEKFPKEAGPGLVIYAGRTALKLNDRCWAMPFDAIVPR